MKNFSISVVLLFFLLLLIGCGGESTNTNITTSSMTTQESSIDDSNESITSQMPSQTEEITTIQQTTQESTTTINTQPTTSALTTQEASTVVSTTQAPTIEETTIIVTQAPTTEPIEETTPNYVLVIFENMQDASGSTVMSSIEGNPLTLPDEPTKQGYVFDGWYMDEAFQVEFNLTEYPSEDIIVYIKWLKMTSVTFDRMNGVSSITKAMGLPGETITYPEAPSKTGFIFDGWYTDINHTSPFILTTFPENDITVYAKWIEEVTAADEMISVLEDEFSFTCVNNVCELEEGSWRIYTFNLNSVEFKLEENITNDDDPSYYKNELLIIDENWNVNYTISESVGNTSMRLTGNILTSNYSFSRFTSSIYEEDDYYNDMINIIQGGQYTSGTAGFLELILETANLTLDDLSS